MAILDDIRLAVVRETEQLSDSQPVTKSSSVCPLMFFNNCVDANQIVFIKDPVYLLVLQGQITCLMNGQKFSLMPGQTYISYLPLTIEFKYTDENGSEPVLGLGLRLDAQKLSKILFEIEKIRVIDSKELFFSSVVRGKIDEKVLSPFGQLMKYMKSPLERDVLSNYVIEEIYFRLLTSSQGGYFKYWLEKNTSLTKIYSVLNYINEHINDQMSINELVQLANMSESTLHKRFKEMFQMSPMQYVKSLKLNRSRTFLNMGHSVSDVALSVGYSCSSQFSREFKRFFGVSPSKLPK